MDGKQVQPVDIVVPVYNGYEDLVKCVCSLRRHTDLSRHRVLLIDDCSPDKRVRDYLRSFCAVLSEGAAGGTRGEAPDSGTRGEAPDSGTRGETPDSDMRGEGQPEKGFAAFFNEKNAGFSANVNRGLAWSDRDTILLNSDTIVTAGWVEKLQACAYRSGRTATVTPLSNAATLASVPEFLRDNPIPDPFTVDSYAALVEAVSLHRYPEIPVAVGFCMYVKNEAYRNVGPFDAETFGRGYGEENDFCCRCQICGYTHVLCDDTFIYHKGTGSFGSEEKERLCREHEQILRDRYPRLMETNDVYCRDDPDGEIRENLKLYASLQNGKPNLLYVLHLDFDETAQTTIGGTQLHVRDLTEGMRRDFNVFVAARDGEDLKLTVYPAAKNAGQGERTAVLRFPIGARELFPVFRDSELEKVFRILLTVFRIRLVHVHHVQGLSLDIFSVCREMGIPVIASLHDYYYACPTTNLIDADGKFCPAKGKFAPGHEGSEACAACLERQLGIRNVRDYIRRWRTENARALGMCRKIVFPSESARKWMLEAFPELESKSLVIGHGSGHESGGAAALRPEGAGYSDRRGAGLSFAEGTLPQEADAVRADGGESLPQEADAVRADGGESLPQEAGAVRADGIRLLRTDKMHSRLDQKPSSEGGFHYITGWAFLEGVRSSKASPYIFIEDSRGCRYLLPLRRAARKDVAAARRRDDYLWSGFHSVFNVPQMAEGRYRMRVVLKIGGRLYTDGAVCRGEFCRIPDAAEGAKRPLNIAFLGGVTPIKGSRLLGEMIRSGDRRFRFFVFGQIGDPDIRPDRCPGNVYFTGAYEREDLAALLTVSHADVACILPVCAETFCYTLSEAWENGLPVIGTDIGAVGERIRRSGGGWLVPADAGVQELTALLEQIREDPGELQQKKEAIRRSPVRSVQEMNADYRKLYRSVSESMDAPEEAGGRKLSQERSFRTDSAERNGSLTEKAACAEGGHGSLPEREFVFQGLARANPDIHGRSGEAENNRLSSENRMLRDSIMIMENTTSYRFARRISDAKIPGKETLKKIARSLRRE